MPLGSPELPADEKDPEKFMRGLVWDVARRRLLSVLLPPFLAREPEGLVRFPGFTNLGHLLK